MSDESKEPFQESNLDSAEYRERLMRKLNCLIAVLEVAHAKVKKSLSGPKPDVTRLRKIQTNLTSTLDDSDASGSDAGVDALPGPACSEGERLCADAAVVECIAGELVEVLTCGADEECWAGAWNTARACPPSCPRICRGSSTRRPAARGDAAAVAPRHYRVERGTR